MWRKTTGILATITIAAVGCNLGLGLGDYHFEPTGGAGGAAASSSSSTSSTSSSTSSASSASSASSSGGPVLPGQPIWAFTLGSTGDDTVNAVAVMPGSGHVFLTGRTGGDSAFECKKLGSGVPFTRGGYLVELDDTGTCVWGLFFGEDAEGTALHVGAAADLYLTANYATSFVFMGFTTTSSGPGAFVARVDADKSNAWIHTITSPGGVESTAVVATLQDVHVGGHTGGVLTVDGTTFSVGDTGGQDGFVLRCVNQPNGQCAPALTIAGAAGTDQRVFGLASAGNKEIAVAGGSVGVTAFNGTLMVPPPSVGDMLSNAAVAVFDSSSVFRANLFGDTDWQEGRRVAHASSGALFFGGLFKGTLPVEATTLLNGGGADAFLMRLDPDGSASALLGLGSDGLEDITFGGLAAGSASDLFVAGGFHGGLVATKSNDGILSTGGEDAFVMRLDENLNLQWSLVFGDAADQAATAVTVAPDGAPVVAGRFQGSIGVGTGTVLTSTGGSDIFVMKIQP